MTQAQVLVNKEWEALNGVPDSIAFSSSALDAQGNVIITTNSVILGQQANLLVMKYDREGNLLWQDNYNGAYNGRDYGVAVTTDNANNIYVAATTQTSLISSSYLVRKYGATGNLLWSTTYSGGGSFNAPTAIAVDNNGNTYVTGVTYSFTTQTDYATLKYDANGVPKWVQTYNYANLYDVPAGIEINNATNSVYVTGASASASNNYDYTTVAYSTINGIQLNVNRVAAVGTGFDKAMAIQRDNVGNIYITGMAFETSSNSYDIKTIKLNVNLQVQWVQTFDKEGLEDAAMALEVDNLGNVCVGGYVNTANEGKNAILLKYDANGSLLWKREYNNNVENGNEEIAKIAIDTQGNVWFAGVSEKGQETDVLTIKYDVNGNLKTLKVYEYAANGTDEASDIKLTNSGEVYISAKVFDGTDYKNGLIKYSTFENPLNVVYDTTGNPLYAEGQVIVKFRPEVVNLDFVNNRDKVFEIVPNVINDSAGIAIENKLGISLSKSKIQKIFRKLTTADSLSISRLGDTVKMPTFWSAFVLHLPENTFLHLVIDSMNTLTNYVQYAELNATGMFANIPNDTYIAQQTSLIPNSTYLNSNINIDPAWDIETGKEYVKVGIFDSPVYWAHEDFGDGTFLGSVVKGGWDYQSNTHISNILSPQFNHGNACAGIIGAIRNNNIGVSGIAGGDFQTSQNGVQIYSFGTTNLGKLYPVLSFCIEAMVEGASSYNHSTGYGYGLNIQNHSWFTDNPSVILSSATRFCFQNNSILVCSRGNAGTNTLKYPACYQDEWGLNIGASGTDGSYIIDGLNGIDGYTSSYGGGVDVIAPGTRAVVITTNVPVAPTNNCQTINNLKYACFNGTSSATPHVAGVIALMQSLHNTQNGYANNLSTEDVEFFLQKYATDIVNLNPFFNYAVGYDEKNGYGRINAGEVLEKLNKPIYHVFHSTNPQSTNIQTLSTGINVAFTGSTQSLPVGFYANCELVEITHTYSNTFPLGTQILDVWARQSATEGIFHGTPMGTPPTGFLLISNTAPFDSLYTYSWNNNIANITLKTYAVFIGNDQVGNPINQWIPAPPNQLKTAYSLHLKDNMVTNNDLPVENKLRILPNPAQENIVVSYEGEKDLIGANLEVREANGKLVYESKFTTDQSINVSGWAQGVYFLKFNTKQACIVQKFVKL